MTDDALGAAVGLTAPSVFERVRKLEQRGVILGYSAIIDSAAVGKSLTAFIRVTTTDDDGWDSGIESCAKTRTSSSASTSRASTAF